MTSYLLVISSGLLAAGRLSDLYGRKQVYTLGMVVFVISSGLCSLSQDLTQLILFRVIQAIGATMVQAIGPAIVTSAFPDKERGKALGIISTAVAIGAITGPALGGIIVDWIDWRAIFWLRVPLGLAGVLFTIYVLQKEQLRGPRPTFDYVGAGTLFVALSSLLLALSQSRYWGWSSPQTVSLLILAVGSLAAFILVESRVRFPMLALDVFRNRMFSAASASTMISFTAASTSFFLMPFFLTTALGMSASEAGLTLMAWALSMSVMGPISVMLSDRFGTRALAALGLAIVSLALFSMTTLTLSSTRLDVMVRLAGIGLGMGIFQSPNNSAIVGSVSRERLGIAAGMMANMRNIGNVIGVALASAVVGSRAVIYAAELSQQGDLGQEMVEKLSFVRRSLPRRLSIGNYRCGSWGIHIPSARVAAKYQMRISWCTAQTHHGSHYPDSQYQRNYTWEGSSDKYLRLRQPRRQNLLELDGATIGVVKSASDRVARVRTRPSVGGSNWGL